ncbi:MAG: SDR family oxidoreductase, partial [Mesorhizobium sp.]|uniref:SDR family NAD(P)-dependent oxidoreductase n=1 Tax=Mesorhizobium sp. TaxID=1871066 RepID=UPI001AD3321E
MLDGKVAIITGAAHPAGIGFAVAQTFAASGAHVVIVDLDQAACDRAAASISGESPAKSPPAAVGFAADVRDKAALAGIVDRVKARFGRLDIVVNNAGIAQARKVLDISDADWEATLDINLRGMLNMAQAAIPVMEDGGAIICLASIAAQRGGGLLGGPHYAASKGGVLALAKSMARELGPRNIRVNCVNPGIIITQMNAT